MKDRDIQAYDSAMERIVHHRKGELSRRRMMQASAQRIMEDSGYYD